MSAPAPIDSPKSSSSSSSSAEDASKREGRTWKKGAAFVGKTLLLLLVVVSVAAFVIGITALVNPVALAAAGASVGAAIAVGFAWAAEYAVFVLVPGAVGLGLMLIAAIISLVAKDKGIA